MKKIYSILAVMILALAGLSATAATLQTKIFVDENSYAVLKKYDYSANGYVTIQRLNTGETSTVELTEGEAYYICPGEGHQFGTVLSDSGAYPKIYKDAGFGGSGEGAMIYATEGQLGNYYEVYTIGPTPPSNNDDTTPKTDFVLTAGSRASVYHYVMWDGDELVDEFIIDKILQEGSNEMELDPALSYYIVAGSGQEFVSVVSATNTAMTINQPNGDFNTQFVSFAGKDASTKYTITTQAASGEVKDGVRFTLAEGSYASVYTANPNDELELVADLVPGKDTYVVLNVEANPYFIVPAPGYELSKVETSDKRAILPEINPAFFATNYVDINNNLSDGYYIETTPAAGIEGIEADNAAAPATYYDLNGRKVSELVPGLYIRMAGGKASKVIIR
ncbi:MAG: hypothetical protein HDS11_03830 [Bacteroides sp.]|nr:hypothetical protein [Bacteroidales bacterium]MBD5316782.1 hypothetical protein [Bacteroides sp.]